MPKRDNVVLECDYCGNYDTIDVHDPSDKVLPIISKWRGVMDGDNPPNAGSDSHRWYDSLDCLTLGEKRHTEDKQEAAEKQAEQDRILARANEQLRRSAFMDKEVKVAKA
jgi:hypothetical protein